MMPDAPRRAAFLVLPHLGGTFTLFVSQRQAMQRLGISLEWLAISADPDVHRADAVYQANRFSGHLLDGRGLSPDESGQALCRWISQEGFECVFVNVVASNVEMSVAAYLPAHIRRIMILHSISLGVSGAARVLRPFVHAAVGVSPRIHAQLLHRTKMPADRAFCIPNALDAAPYDVIPRLARTESLRVLCLGRVIEPDKGVLWLPEIMRLVRHLGVTLTIAGDGPQLGTLKRRMAGGDERVRFLGNVLPAQVPALMKSHDVLLMPSRFEGFGIALIEAMAGGCVPVASRIEGVTDFVVQHEGTGLLFPTGNTGAAAASIERLAREPGLLERLSVAGASDVRARFSIGQLTEGYRQVLASLNNPPAIPARGDGPFEVLPFGGQWRGLIPSRIKNLLQSYLYR